MNRKSAIAFSIAPIIISAIGFVFIPILSWWLREDDMAKFAVFQTNINFFALIVGLGLDQALAREFHETRSPAKLLRKVLQLVLFSIPFGVTGMIIIKLYGGGVASASITTGMMAACSLMLLNRIFSSFIRMSGNGVAYAVDIVTPKIFQLLVLALLGSQAIIVITYDVVVGIFVFSSGAALAYEIWMARRIGVSYELNGVTRGTKPAPHHFDLLRFSVPLVPGALAFYAISASAIYVVGMNGNSREVVTTSLAISVGSGLAVLQSVFVTLWTPFAYRWHARKGTPTLYSHVATLVTMGCAVFLLASLFVAPYFPVFFPEKYNGIPKLLVLVIVWNLLYLISIVGSFGIGVKRMSFTSMTISLIGATLSIGMSLISSKYFGSLGVFLSVLSAFIVTLVLNCEFSSKGWERVVRMHHYAMVAAIVCSGMMFSLGHEWEAVVVLVLSIILYLPKFRSGVIQTYAIYKKFEK